MSLSSVAPYIPGVVLLGCATTAGLLVLDRQFGIIKSFRAERRGPFDLAIARVAVFATIQWQLNLADLLTFTKLDPSLRSGPLGWQPILNLVPLNPMLVEMTFVAACILNSAAILGIFSRCLLPLATGVDFYLLTVPQLFGKVTHTHHLIIFSVLLSASPCADALSLDRLIKTRRSATTPPLTLRSRVYGTPLKAMTIVIGLIYFFPGAWKLSRVGLHWFAADNMRAILLGRFLAARPTGMGVWLVHQPMALSAFACGAVIFELGLLYALVCPRLRWIAAAAGLAFHGLAYEILRISFWWLPPCYVVLIDWTALRYRTGPDSTHAITCQERDGAHRFQCRLSFSLVASMVAAGVVHAVGAWPIACYPTFDWTEHVYQEVSFEAAGVDGRIYSGSLTFDPRTSTLYPPEIWGAMVNSLPKTAGRLLVVRARATVQMWKKANHCPELNYVRLYQETEDLSGPRCRLLRRDLLCCLRFAHPIHPETSFIPSESPSAGASDLRAQLRELASRPL